MQSLSMSKHTCHNISVTQPFHCPLGKLKSIEATVDGIGLTRKMWRIQDLDSLSREVWVNSRVPLPLLRLPLSDKESSDHLNLPRPLPTQAVKHHYERLRKRMLVAERGWDSHLIRPEKRINCQASVLSNKMLTS